MTTVTNMRNSTEQTFDLEPLDAVRAAYRQSLGDFNTWDYEFAECPVEWGTAFVFCGDFSAKRNIRH